MVSTGTCPRCGTLLYREAAAGLCPKCLGSLGFVADPDSEPGAATEGDGRRQRLGDYELIEEIARGGMGVVYRARQISLNRVVAVKVVLHGPFSSPEFVQRFRTEAAVVAGLQHPHIVAIHEVGQANDEHFFSMDYIAGQDLGELVREQPLPARRAAELLQTIAEAVHYAHQRGVVHRDLKPSNVLVDASGLPRITDFGLAKLVGTDAELTTTGQVLGSPGYIAPEQAAGRREEAGPAGDIYSLGAILYQLLTGRPPFQGETLPEVLLQVQTAEPVSPRRLNPSVPVDLQTICLKCLQKQPARRYGTAQELADDLERFLAHEPIQARPVGWPGRFARWCQRKPALAVMLGVCGLLLVAIATGSPIFVWRINRERITAETARKLETTARVRAETAEKETEQQLSVALLEQARASVLVGEMGHRVRALDALHRAAAISNHAELRREVLAALILPDLEFEMSLPWDDSFTLRSLDPGFERVALCRNGGDVEIRSTHDQKLLTTLPAATRRPVYNSTEWSPDGKYLAIKRDRDNGGLRADWEIWDVAQSQRLLWLRDIVQSTVSFDAQSTRLLAGQLDGEVVIRALPATNTIARIHLPSQALVLRFSPQADRFAAVFSLDHGTRVAVHDATNGQRLSAHNFAGRVPTVAWHPEGKWLAVPEHSSAVYAMDAQTGGTRLLGQHKAEANTAAFSPDGAYLFTGGWEGEIIGWDARALRRSLTIGLQAEIIKPSRNGQHYAVMTRSGLRVYRFAPPECVRLFPEDLGERLMRGTFSADGHWLAASAARGLGLWNLTTNNPGVTLAEGYAAYPSLSSDGTELLASRVTGNDVASFRWHLQTSAINPSPILERLPLFQPKGFCFFSQHSNTVAVTTEQGSQWLPVNQLETAPARWQPTAVGMNKVSPDGRWLAINAPWSERVHVYQLPALNPVARLRHLGNVAGFVFSPDGEQLALASLKGVQLWRTRDWKLVRTLPDFTGILFQPGSHPPALWLMKDFRTAGLYEADTLELLLPLPNGLYPLAISPDGNRLAISADLRRLQLWDLNGLRQKLREMGMDWVK